MTLLPILPSRRTRTQAFTHHSWGSGVSRSAGIPTGLEITIELVKIAGIASGVNAEANTARLRRVYVAASSRGQHVGHALVKALLTHAALRFRSVQLSTDTPECDSFYLHCGFVRTDIPHATHVMQLGNS